MFIILIVLLDAAGGSLNQVLGGTNEVEVWLLEKLSHVTWITWARRESITEAPFITTSSSAAAPTSSD